MISKRINKIQYPIKKENKIKNLKKKWVRWRRMIRVLTLIKINKTNNKIIKAKKV